MNNMKEFYASLPHGSSILEARKEFNRMQKIFSEEETEGEELPDVFAATTLLRSELEDYPNKPAIVIAYIGLLDADVSMMRSIIANLKED